MQVNGTAKVIESKKAAARTAAGIAVQVVTGLPGLSALQAFDAVMDSLRKSGMVTVAARQLDDVAEHVSKLTYALAQAYVHIEALDNLLEGDSGDGETRAEVLQLIEQALGGKPQKVDESAAKLDS